MAKTRQAHFGPGLFAFLRELKAHNDREWFAAHKDRYVAEVEAPLLRFISDLGERLPRVSRSFVADPRRAGGSMFRIHRDTRFSADKSPYKTHAAAHFQHREKAKDRTVPGFYLHLDPDGSFAGGGVYHPDPDALARIRQRIVAKPKEWEAVLRAGLEVQGDSLKRPPAGFDPGHRFVADLKRKDHYSMLELGAREVCAPDFLDSFVGVCERTAPLMKFLTKALDLPW